MNFLSPYNVLYFGSWGRKPGHFLWTTTGTNNPGVEKRLPWRESEFYRLPPQVYRSDYDRDEAPQGHAALHVRKDWTAIAFWDRSVDKRGNCMSAFFLRGIHQWNDAIQIAKHHFPSVWERFPWEVRLVQNGIFTVPDALTMEEKAADYARLVKSLELVVEERDRFRDELKALRCKTQT